MRDHFSVRDAQRALYERRDDEIAMCIGEGEICVIQHATIIRVYSRFAITLVRAQTLYHISKKGEMLRLFLCRSHTFCLAQEQAELKLSFTTGTLPILFRIEGIIFVLISGGSAQKYRRTPPFYSYWL